MRSRASGTCGVRSRMQGAVVARGFLISFVWGPGARWGIFWEEAEGADCRDKSMGITLPALLMDGALVVPGSSLLRMPRGSFCLPEMTLTVAHSIARKAKSWIALHSSVPAFLSTLGTLAR